MKKRLTALLAAALAALTLLCFAGCRKSETPEETSAKTEETTVTEEQTAEADSTRWTDAVYTQDTTLGEGEKTILVEVRADGKTVTFTVKTNADTLGDALTENKLLEGEQGPYGLYVKAVNGMTADYDIDGTYWALYKDGEMSMTGVDGAGIADGDHFALSCETMA